MSERKKSLQIIFLFAFIYMMMCPVVHALHDRSIGHAVFNFPLHKIVQNYFKGDLKLQQEGIVCSSLIDYNTKFPSSLNLPLFISLNPSNNLFIVTTTRLNL